MDNQIKNILDKLKSRKKKQIAGLMDPDIKRMYDGLEQRFYEKYGEHVKPRELFRRLPKSKLQHLLNSTNAEMKSLRKVEELLGVTSYA